MMDNDAHINKLYDLCHHNDIERDILANRVVALEGDDGTALRLERDQLLAENALLRQALFRHRGDLHEYSTRPCPTCRFSAKILGIETRVPDTCARGRSDSAALTSQPQTSTEQADGQHDK